MDPDLYLATLSVDAYGKVPSSRSIPLKNMLMAQGPVCAGNSNVDLGAYNFLDLSLAASLEYMLTIIDYKTTPMTNEDTNNTGKLDDDSSKPFLTLQLRYLTWAYSSNSRASHFGIAIAIAGVLVTTAHTILATMDMRQYRGLTDMLIAALEHYPRGEFEGVEQDSGKASCVKFRLIETADRAGKLMFKPPGRKSDKEDIDPTD